MPGNIYAMVLLRVSQPWHYWYLGWTILRMEGYPVHWRIFSSYLGLCPLEVSRTLHPLADNQKCLKTLPSVSLGANLLFLFDTLSLKEKKKKKKKTSKVYQMFKEQKNLGPYINFFR